MLVAAMPTDRLTFVREAFAYTLRIPPATASDLAFAAQQKAPGQHVQAANRVVAKATVTGF